MALNFVMTKITNNNVLCFEEKLYLCAKLAKGLIEIQKILAPNHRLQKKFKPIALQSQCLAAMVPAVADAKTGRHKKADDRPNVLLIAHRSDMKPWISYLR